MTKIAQAVFVASVLMTTDSSAYEVVTHRFLSERSIHASGLARSTSLSRWGFARPIVDKEQRFPDGNGVPLTIVDLIRSGAEREDDVLELPPRPLNHFFDPTTGKGLWIEPHPWLGIVSPTILNLIGLANLTNQASPDWALTATAANEFSRAGLSNVMHTAYTARDRTVRHAAIGRMFETIGRLVHHVQDMAQPQHVRNDAHLHDEGLEERCPTPPKAGLENTYCLVYRLQRAPSSYELWTQALPVETLPVSGYESVYGPTGDGSFDHPRKFWVNGGKGLAEFTQRNFVSAGTMRRTPPALGTPFEVRAADLCMNLTVLPCGEISLEHSVRFYPSVVDDALRPDRGGPNPFAAAESIYDADFRRIVGGAPVPTVNRFTFAHAHARLLPRAVAYSTGLIDYLFRGEIDVSPPAQGVYGIVDTSLEGCDNPCAFRKVKLRLQNVTPGSERMGPGELQLVAKFRRNLCHRPDLAGHFGGPQFAGNACRSDERIAVSAPQPVTYEVARGMFAEERTFSFVGLDFIPVEATDLQLQVVFRGRLGLEDDAVAVSTIDVAEPNFIAVANNTDHYFDAAANRYRPSTGTIYPYRLDTVRLWFADPAANPVPLASLTALDGGQHAQVAILADKAPLRYWLRDTTQMVSYPDIEGEPFPLQEFVLDESGAAPLYRTNCPVVLARGMYRQYVEMYIRDDRGSRFVPTSSPGLDDRKGGVSAKLASMPCHGWVAPGAGGITDFSALTPQFTPGTANTWAVNF